MCRALQQMQILAIVPVFLPVSNTACGWSKGNGLPRWPIPDKTGKIIPLSTITSGSLPNKADFCPAEAVFSVSYHENV